MKTKLQGTRGMIDITKSSVKDIKNRNEKESRKWNWNKRDKRTREKVIEKIQYIYFENEVEEQMKNEQKHISNYNEKTF